MTNDQMLQKLGLSNEQFQDLQRKHAAFFSSLDPQQQVVVKASSPSLAQAAASFGPGASEADLQRLIDQNTPNAVMLEINWLAVNSE